MADAGHALVHVHDAVARHARGRSASPSPRRIFRSRWHQAWSRGYVCRKYGLPDGSLGMAVANAGKALLALPTLSRARAARYAGSAAGAFAAWRRKDAIAREGLHGDIPA